MLRITLYKDAAAMRFVIEGKLAGPWVEELKQCWLAALDDESDAALSVDLSAVTFIDFEARTLLAEMHRQGVRLSATGLMTKTVIAEIVGS